MSFTSTIKEEVTKLDTTKLENISELSAIFRIASNINKTIINKNILFFIIIIYPHKNFIIFCQINQCLK